MFDKSRRGFKIISALEIKKDLGKIPSPLPPPPPSSSHTNQYNTFLKSSLVVYVVFKCLNKFHFQFLSHTNHFQKFRSHMWPMATVWDKADSETFPTSQIVLLGRAALEPGSKLACKPPPHGPGRVSQPPRIPICIVFGKCPELWGCVCSFQSLECSCGIKLSSKAWRKEFYFPNKPFLIFPIRALPLLKAQTTHWTSPTAQCSLLHAAVSPGPGDPTARRAGQVRGFLFHISWPLVFVVCVFYLIFLNIYFY